MASLFEVQKTADELSSEDRAGLVAHLLSSFSSAPAGPDDNEVDRRDAELDSGEVAAMNHAAFLEAFV